ncbi:MAG: phosphatase PAP2 family protein [Gemmatimonadota bacterium]|nr:phosphatase PAP2 family protein [Gemmatimonadota bacterium]
MQVPFYPETSPTTEEAQRLMGAALLVGLLAAAAALLLFIWLGGEIQEGEVLTLDERIRALVHQVASPGLTAFMRGASLYGGPAVLIPAGVAVALAFLVKGWRRGAFLVIVTLAGAGLLNGLLKLSFARVRPEPFFDYPLPGSPSFPSGHALYAASVFGGLAALFSARLASHLLRVLVWSAALLLVGLIGLSRVYLGVHYPSDVLAGFAVGVIWVTAVAFGDRLAQHRRRRRSG